MEGGLTLEPAAVLDADTPRAAWRVRACAALLALYALVALARLDAPAA
jgi:hypothetical protein